MDDGDGRGISTAAEKKKLGPNVADYAGLTAGLQRASSKEGAILRRNQKFSERRQPEELAAFLEQELSNGGIFGQGDRALISVGGLMAFPEA